MSQAESDARIYGAAPYAVAVLHGGPGAVGTMAPVARVLASDWGVLEPLLTARSIEGQIEQLRSVLDRFAAPPVTLIGSSWGAMLGYIFTARFPAKVRTLILVGSGPYEARYAEGIDQTRWSRLTDDERQRALSLEADFAAGAVEDKDAIFAQMGELFAHTDAYDPVSAEPEQAEDIQVRYEVFAEVWPEAEVLRASGQLLALGHHIHCPVLAIHGMHDPHPSEGIRQPLSRVLSDFRFVLLPHCGHEPWIERQARDEFYRLVREELRTQSPG